MSVLRVSEPVGDNKPNRTQDVEGLGLALQRVGYLEPSTADGAAVTEGLLDALRSFQGDHGVASDGVVTPRGETEQAINNDLLGKPRGSAFLERPPIALRAPVGDGQANRPGDVKQIKVALGGLGLMPEDPFDDPHGFVDHGMLDGLKAFQADQSLKVDGLAAPGGPTVTRLNGAIAKQRKEIAPLVASYRRRAQDADQTQDRTKQDHMGRVEPVVLPTPPDFWKLRIDPKWGPRPLPIPLLFPGLRRRITPLGPQLNPGRPATPQPPTIFKGPDPRKRPAPDQSAPGYPSEPPKVPNKEEIRPEHPLIQDSIEIFPDQSKDLNEPLIVENRQGTPPIKKQNWELAGPLRENGEMVFGEDFVQFGGPKKEYGEEYKEHYIPNPDTRDKKPRTTKGSSYMDATFAIRLPKKNKDGTDRFVIVHLDTFTPSKGSHDPDSREQKQHKKLMYNERRHAFIVRTSKLREGEAIDMQVWDRYTRYMMYRIKGAIENGLFDDPSHTWRLVRYFRVIVPK